MKIDHHSSYSILQFLETKHRCYHVVAPLEDALTTLSLGRQMLEEVATFERRHRRNNIKEIFSTYTSTHTFSWYFKQDSILACLQFNVM